MGRWRDEPPGLLSCLRAKALDVFSSNPGRSRRVSLSWSQASTSAEAQITGESVREGLPDAADGLGATGTDWTPGCCSRVRHSLFQNCIPSAICRSHGHTTLGSDVQRIRGGPGSSP